MPDAVIHPTPEDLTAFSLGQLPSAEAAVIESHISECKTCCETLMGLSSDDTFVGLLRVGYDAASEQTVDRITNDDSIPSNTCEIPPPLVNHPRYRILGLIGQGGMGDVYEAEHLVMNRTVALKVIKRNLVNKPDAIKRFHREVQAAATLSHPNIVTAHDADQAGDAHFLVTEYVDGIELSDIVEREGPLAVGIACDYVHQVAQGLQHAYESDMVHRDIKPQNLMVTQAGQVKILDFGLASIGRFALADSMINTESDDDKALPARLTSLDTVMGTPDYIAPEQTVDSHAADIRSDIYGLGCTLYYLLTGQPPFPEGSAVEKVLAHTEREPRPLGELRNDLPSGLEPIVRRMMAKNPADRFKEPSEVAAALSPFVEREGSLKRQVATSSGSFWRRWVAVAAAVFIVGLAFVLTFRTSDGTVTVEIADAHADDVEVTFRQGKQLHIASAKQGWQIRLKEGQWNIELGNSSDKFQLDKETLTLVRGGQETLKVTLKKRPEPFQRTGKPLLATLRGHEAEVHAVVYAPDSKMLASSSSDGTIRLWAAETGELLTTLRGHTDEVRAVALSPDGDTLASAGGDGKVLLWDMATRKLQSTLKLEAIRDTGFCFSPDGKTLAAGKKHGINLYDSKSGSLVNSLDLKDDDLLSSHAVGPEVKRLAVASTSNARRGSWVTLFDAESGRELWKIWGDRRSVCRLAFSPDGKTLATGNADHYLRLLNVADGRVLAQLPGYHPSHVLTIAFSPDSKTLASSSWGQMTIWLWDVPSRRKLATLSGHFGHVTDLVFYADGRTLASAGVDGNIKIWDVQAAIAAAQSASDGATAAAEMTVDRYVVPEGSVAELLKFIQDLQRFRPKSSQQHAEHRQKAPAALKVAAEKVLKLEQDEWSEAYQTALRVLLEARISTIREATPDSQRQTIEFVKTFLTAKLEKEIESADVSLAISAARALEYTDNQELAAEAYRSFAELVAKSENEDVSDRAKKMVGAARRLTLLGKERKMP